MLLLMLASQPGFDPVALAEVSLKTVLESGISLAASEVVAAASPGLARSMTRCLAKGGVAKVA